MELFKTLNEFTPMGIVAFALLIVYFQLKNKKEVNSIKSNHFPEINESLKRIEDKLEILNDIKTNTEIIKIKLNNK